MYSRTPCAACKTQRRKCTKECVFASCFPPDQTNKFVTVHQVFGASNVSKLLRELPPSEREDAANSLYWEAQCRIADPIYGCVGSISILQQQLKHIQGDVEAARHELAQYIGDEAYVPMSTDPALAYPGMVLPEEVVSAYALIRDGAAQAYLRKPRSQAPQHGMFPMMGGQPQQQLFPLPLSAIPVAQQQQVYEGQPLSSILPAQQLLPLQQQQVYGAQPLSAIPEAQQQLQDYSTYEGQQILLSLYGQGQQHQHLQQPSSSGNARHGHLNHFSVGGGGGGDGSSASGVTCTGLSLGNYHHVRAYHMQQQQHPQQLGQPGTSLNQKQQLGDELGLTLNHQQQLGDEIGLNLNQQQQLGDELGLNLNQQQQLGDELGLNLNHQKQDFAAQLAEARMFLGLGPLSPQQPPGHPRSKSDTLFDPADGC